MDFRIGHGIDIHPFSHGRRLVLGGVEVPHALGLDGHSDADVLLHSLMDAMLGAAGLPDIGYFFPPFEEKWKDAESLLLLGTVVAEIEKRGWKVVNSDTTILAEAPKIAPYVIRMKESIGEVLKVSPESVGIKATTAERLGAIGRSEGICASSVVLLRRDAPTEIDDLKPISR